MNSPRKQKTCDCPQLKVAVTSLLALPGKEIAGQAAVTDYQGQAKASSVPLDFLSQVRTGNILLQ